jgi:integrase
MGRAFERKGNKGSTWYIEYYYQGKQEREKVGRTKDGITEKQAKEALKARMGDIVKGKFDIAQTKSFPLFSKLMKDYLEWSTANKKAYERDFASAKHLSPFFGNKRIDEIDNWLIEKYRMKRKQEIKSLLKNKAKAEIDISFASINREVALLKHFYTKAVEWGKIDVNPSKGIKMFKEKSKDRYLEAYEIESLVKACEQTSNKDLKGMVLTAIYAGLRISEVFNLKVSDLDFKNDIINLEDTKNGDRGKVPMADYIKSQLQAHLKDHSFEYVFCKSDGSPYKDIRASLASALEKAGIKDCTFHTLRHTFASQLALNGVDLYTMQELGRWKTLDMVKKYAHLSPHHKKTAINKLNGLFSDKQISDNTLIEGKFGRVEKNA